MIRWAAAVFLLSCAEKPAPVGLRVPLPDGWSATPRGTGLDVGPRGRVVLSLERKPSEVPKSLELSRAASIEGASTVIHDDADGFAAVRYSLGGGREGFLAVRKTAEGEAVWCASTASASAADVDNGLALCRTIGLTPAK